MGAPWRVIQDGHQRAAENMARDEALLLGPLSRPTLRIYGWRPAALSLGYFQRSPPDLSSPTIEHLEVVRRATGGGAIIHDCEVTYCLVVDGSYVTEAGEIADFPLLDSYHFFHRALVGVLGDFRVQIDDTGQPPSTPDPSRKFFCFDRHAKSDLIAQGRKIAGSAQRRANGRILQHGSLLLAGSPLIPGSIGINDLREDKDAAGFDEVASSLCGWFGRILGARMIEEPFTPGEVRHAENLVETRYRDPNWARASRNRRIS